MAYNQSAGSDVRDLAVGTGIAGQLRDVADGTVGIVSEYGQLLRMGGTFEQAAAGRIQLDFDAPRRALGIGPATFANPLPQDRIRRVTLRQLEAAAVRDFDLRLIQQQTVVGAERVGPPAKVFANERQPVEYRIERPQRHAKAAFAARRAVASAAV